MVTGLNMLSFDLFGLGGRQKVVADEDRLARNEEDANSDMEEQDRLPSSRDQEIFFWALCPTI